MCCVANIGHITLPHAVLLSVSTSELYHISGVRTRVQKVKPKPKMAEFEELLYKTSILVLGAVNIVKKTLVQ